MVVKTYKCDLCRTELKLDDLIPIYWASGPDGGTLCVNRISPSDTNHHLCKKCVREIRHLNVGV